MKTKDKSRLVINENTVPILPRLAVALGLNEAVILQQIHYWIEINKEKKSEKHFKDGCYWTYNSYKQWQEQLPFWSSKTIMRAIKKLECTGIVVSANYNKWSNDHTKWYRIDYDALIDWLGQNDQADGSNCPSSLDKMSRALPKTTTEITSENTYGRGGKICAERAKENQGERVDSLTDVDTKKELAKVAGVSHDTKENNGHSIVPFDIQCLNIIQYLNEKIDSRYKPTTESTQRLIRARLDEGYTLEDFKTVINKKVNEWQGTEREKFLRPETLFGTKFESYLNQKIIRPKASNPFLQMLVDEGREDGCHNQRINKPKLLL